MKQKIGKKIMVVFGTRPEVIKMAPVIIKIREKPDRFECVVVSTGQHAEMLDKITRIFDIQIDHELNIMQPSQTLFDISSRCLDNYRDLLEKEKPHLLLVQGDTTTAFITALAAFFYKIPVGHVEAGLRTYHKYNPFPEEMNRKLITSIADIHFAPTKNARRNLIRENISPGQICVTGNTVIDALLMMREKTRTNDKIRSGFEEIDFGKRIVLITSHRRESFGQPFNNICEAIRELAKMYTEVEFVYPVHLNPNVQNTAFSVLEGTGNVHLISPLDYEAFVFLMDSCYLVLTDSGGVQEEAPSLGKPVLVMRDTTERPECIAAGVANLLGTDKNKIILEVRRLLDNDSLYCKMSRKTNPYGDGKAADRIVGYLSGEKIKEF